MRPNATGNAVQPMCGFARRGDGWLTLFRVSKAKESPSFMHSICITIFFEVFKKLTTGQEAPWTGFSMLIRFHVSVSPTGSEED